MATKQERRAAHKERVERRRNKDFPFKVGDKLTAASTIGYREELPIVDRVVNDFSHFVAAYVDEAIFNEANNPTHYNVLRRLLVALIQPIDIDNLPDNVFPGFNLGDLWTYFLDMMADVCGEIPLELTTRVIDDVFTEWSVGNKPAE